MSDTLSQNKICDLNDMLRKELKGGTIIQTNAYAALNIDIRNEFLNLIRAKDEFDPDDDPYGEHDFGSESIGSITVFWKIDYFDNMMSGLSADPSDPSMTKRVMTLMLASEY